MATFILQGREFDGSGWTQETVPYDFAYRMDAGGSLVSLLSAGTAGPDGVVAGFFGQFLLRAGGLPAGYPGSTTQHIEVDLPGVLSVVYDSVRNFTALDAGTNTHLFTFTAFGVSDSFTLFEPDTIPPPEIGFTVSYDIADGYARLHVNFTNGNPNDLDLPGVDGSGFAPNEDLGPYTVTLGNTGGSDDCRAFQAALDVFPSDPVAPGVIRNLIIEVCGEGPCPPFLISEQSEGDITLATSRGTGWNDA